MDQERRLDVGRIRMTWTEHPFFLPYAGDHLAGVITVPSMSPKAFAVFLQGLGAPRSHRYSLWSRIARDIAADQIASLRFDYRGMGDSTGGFVADLADPPVEESAAMIDHAASMLGVSRFAAVGNCMGVRVALGVGPERASCVGIGCIVHNWPKEILDGFGQTRPVRVRAAIESRLSHLAPTLGVAFARWSLGRKMTFIPEMRRAADEVETLLLFVGPEGVGRALERAASRLGRRPPVTQVIPEDRMPGFQLSMKTQDIVANRIASWLRTVLLTPGPVAGEPQENSLQFSK
jgi:pimeloyl-ACP methyl ester carboxylesterase